MFGNDRFSFVEICSKLGEATCTASMIRRLFPQTGRRLHERGATKDKPLFQERAQLKPCEKSGSSSRARRCACSSLCVFRAFAWDVAVLLWCARAKAGHVIVKIRLGVGPAVPNVNLTIADNEYDRRCGTSQRLQEHRAQVFSEFNYTMIRKREKFNDDEAAASAYQPQSALQATASVRAERRFI